MTWFNIEPRSTVGLVRLHISSDLQLFSITIVEWKKEIIFSQVFKGCLIDHNELN